MLISITDLIVHSIALYKKHTKKFVTYALLIFIPGACITIMSAILPIFVPSTFTVGVIGVSYLLYVLFAFILSFVSFWFSIAFIRIIAKGYTGQAIQTVSEELQGAKAVFWPAIGVSILTALAVFGGMLLLVIPGIIFGIWFAFSVYSTAIDHHSPIEAMTISKQMVDGRWWAVFWRLAIPSMVFAFLIVAVQFFVELPLQFVLDHTDTRTLLYVSWGVLAELISALIALLLAPLTTAIPTILYIELKKHPAPGKAPTKQMPA